MVFDPQMYISPNEVIVLSGNCYYDMYCQTVKYALTTRKIIQAGENFVRIIPLNKITQLQDVGKSIKIFSTGVEISFYHNGHPEWYGTLLQEIAKRIG